MSRPRLLFCGWVVCGMSVLSLSMTGCGLLEFKGVEVGVTQTQGDATRTGSLNRADTNSTALSVTAIFGVPDDDSEVQAQRELTRALREASRDADRRHADHTAAEAAEAARDAAEGSGDVTVTVGAQSTPAPTPTPEDDAGATGILSAIPDAPKTVEEGQSQLLWGAMLLLAACAYRVFRYGLPGFRRELKVPPPCSHGEHPDPD